jgi:hypothetical protein
METAFTIPLDTDWFCTYFHHELLDEMADGHDFIHLLSEWTPRKGTLDANISIWLNRTFNLEPTDYCVRYYLHIDATPGEISLAFSNTKDYLVEKQTGPMVIDVTDYVTLEGNNLSLRLDPSTARLDGKFSGVRLEAVPCE